MGDEGDGGPALSARFIELADLAVGPDGAIYVSDERANRVRVIRENRIIGDYALESLKREKDDAREVREGLECGIKLAGFNDIKEGDILEAYKVEEVARVL